MEEQQRGSDSLMLGGRSEPLRAHKIITEGFSGVAVLRAAVLHAVVLGAAVLGATLQLRGGSWSHQPRGLAADCCPGSPRARCPWGLVQTLLPSG